MFNVTAVVGRNGSGKTLYIERLRRLMASDKVRYIAFTDSYGVNVDGQYYLNVPICWQVRTLKSEGS